MSAVDYKKIGKAECARYHAALIKQTVVHAPADGCDTCHGYPEKEDKAEVSLKVF